MKRDYLSGLARSARWYLPPAEAAEVLEDYQEIVEGRSEEELRRDLGTPRMVVKQLAQPKEYHRWLAVFAALTVCIGLPAITPFWQELSLNVFKLFRFYWFWDIGKRIIPFIWVFFAVGMVLSLAWFRRGSGKKTGRAVPKGVLPLLAVLLAGMACLWAFESILLRERWDIINALAPTPVRASMMRLTLCVDIFSMGLIGLLGLVKSRLEDRRWGAVYVLGLAGTILGLLVWGFLTSLNFGGFVPGWQIPFIARYAFVTLAGIVGTAVSLC